MSRKQLSKEDFKQHAKRSEGIRRVLVDYIAEIPEKKIAVFLSSGVDSHAMLFAALEAKKQPTIYSFTLDDRESKDFISARNTAGFLNLPFVPVRLSTSVDYLVDYVSNDIYGPINPGIKINKASVECLWPMFETIDLVKERAILVGFNADAWYCTLRVQKKAWLAGTYDEYVDKYFNLYNNGPCRDAQVLMIRSYLRTYKKGTQLYLPYTTPEMFKVMQGMDPIHEGCRPIQKAPVRLAFWDMFEACRNNVYIHTSLQKGDSGISEHFENLLVTHLNTKGFKNVIGIYNEFLREWQEKYKRNAQKSMFEVVK